MHAALILLTVVLATLAGSARAQAHAPPAGEFRKADWLQRPSAGDLQLVWPRAAFERGLGGSVIIACQVTAAGRLTVCTTDSETPAGHGFGAAALALTPQFLMRPATLNGVPVASAVRIPINFPSFSPGSELMTPTVPVLRPATAWLQAPALADMRDAYPPKLRAAGGVGTASVECRIRARGELGGCKVVRVSPRGLGVGIATRNLVKLFRTEARRADGRVMIGGLVTIPFTFRPDLFTPQGSDVPENWVSWPTPEQVRTALGSGAGEALFACNVAQGGAISDCAVESEAPAGSGFGRRALALMPSFRSATWSDTGDPVVGQRLRFPIRMVSPATPAAQP